MEMMSPQQYKDANKDKSLQELMALKEQLQSEIVSLSQNQDKESPFISDTRLQMKQQYFDKIWELIKEKREKLSSVKIPDKEDYDEKMEFFEQMIFDKRCFFVEIKSGAVIPVFNPNYYNRVEISLAYDYREKHNKVLIRTKEYSINEEQFKTIQQMVEESFSKLIELARNQTMEEYAGTYNTVRVKLGTVFLSVSLDNTSNEEEHRFLSEFENKIINILSIDSNEKARYVYDEGANNLWIKETIQNTLNSVQEDSNPKCIFCGGNTAMEFVKDSKGGHEALICTKCNKYQNSVIIEDNSVQPSKNIDEVVEELVNKILELPKGTEISISSLLGEKFKNYNTNEMFEINKRVLSICKEKGVVFNFDKYKDQAVGLPFNIPFIIE